MKENHRDSWVQCNDDREIINYILTGYRNIRINNLEFFVVNIHTYRDDRFRLFTPCGRIIYFDYYTIKIPVYVDYNKLSDKFYNIYNQVIGNDLVLKFGHYKFEILTKSYPYNAYSRPIQIRKI